jgi:FkbM family methyltransferase
LNDWRLWAIAGSICSPGDTIVEVGANIGTETIGYSDFVGSHGGVFAFEPLPRNQAILRLSLAEASHSNITVLPYALGATEGVVPFAEPPRDQSSGIGHVLGPDEVRTGTVTHDGRPLAARVVEVACRTLDSFEATLPKVRLLVVDAEGSELMIIRGAARRIRTDRPAIVVEAAPAHLVRAGSNARQLYDELASQGYCVFEVGLLSVDEIGRVPSDGSIVNWLCLPEDDVALIRDVRRTILRAAFLPLVRSLNPLRRPLR